MDYSIGFLEKRSYTDQIEREVFSLSLDDLNEQFSVKIQDDFYTSDHESVFFSNLVRRENGELSEEEYMAQVFNPVELQAIGKIAKGFFPPEKFQVYCNSRVKNCLYKSTIQLQEVQETYITLSIVCSQDSLWHDKLCTLSLTFTEPWGDTVFSHEGSPQDPGLISSYVRELQPLKNV